MKQTTMVYKRESIDYFLVDAKEKRVGRLAVEIANALRGKDKPTYVPHMDCGDAVVVINSKDIQFTGNKWNQKKYYSHSTQPGKLKTVLASRVHEKDPTQVLYKAVKGMMPRNRLSAVQLTRLRIFPGSEHALQAQKPVEVDTLRSRGN